MPKTIEGLQGAGKVPNKAISVKTRDATPKPGMIPTLTRPCLAYPELEPTDDEIEAELNTMLGAPAAAAALADVVKQEA